MKKILATIMMLFGCLMAAMGQSYHIGDLYTAPDGSLGIVYYIHPDGSGGWVVALKDCPARPWGQREDVPGVPTGQYDGFLQHLLTDTSGYANTLALRTYQMSNNNYAAGRVDFENGWYLPAPAQLSMLFGQLPFISDAIVNAGGELMTGLYWSSSAADQQNGCLVNFYNGAFISASKDLSRNIREVRSFTNVVIVHDTSLTYLWNTGSTQPFIEVAPEQTTTYSVTVTTQFGCSNTAEQTVIVDTGEWQVVYDTICQGTGYEGYGFSLSEEETDTVGTLTFSHTIETEDCPGTLILYLTLLSPPAIIHSPDILLSAGSSVTLWASGADAIVWTDRNGNAIGNGNSLTVNTEEDTFFYLLASIGTDSVFCTTLDSISVRIITDFPDNVEDVDCTIDALQQPWDAQVLHSVNDIHCYFVPLVGDIDGDGNIEIVAGKVTNNDYNVTTIGIYRGSDLQQIGTINTPQPIHAGYGGPMALVRYPDGNGGLQGAVVLLCDDDKLRSYDIHGQLLTTSDINAPCTGAISITDFNHDGWPEVYIGNAVYDAATLRRLCAGPPNGNKGLSWRGTGSGMAMSFAANVLGDEFPELICGNSIYSVHIGSRTDVSQNSVNLLETITLPNSIPQDGNVAVADFNLDGQLDVLVVVDPTPNTILDTSYFYAYDPVSGDLLFIHRHYARTVGFPFVGDIDGDGFLEFVYLDYQSSVTNSRITAMQYRPGTGLQMQWQATHADESGQTSMTLFDFNQDGIMEIVYRDQDRLRIINGSGRSHQTGNDTVPFYDLYSVNMTAGTWKEYPVVADVNSDGHAEIVTCGRMTTGLGFVGGQLVVVGGIHPWAPARKVWNQYMYNVTNINENLTVPRPLFNNATVFTDPNHVVRRPFNNFLQQGTTIDHYGRPFSAVPDAAANSIDIQTVEDSVLITINYCNIGDNTLPAPYPVTIFANAYNGDIIATSIVNESLPVDSCSQITIRLSANTFCDILDLDSLVAAINCAGEGIAQNGGLPLECDTSNNTAGTTISIQRDTTFITDTVCDTHLWYDETLTQTGEYYHNNPDCSVMALSLTVNYGTHNVTDAIVCDTYTWTDVTNETYTESGTYTLEYTNASGCPSADTLHLTVYPTSDELVEITVCKSDLPYRWNDVTFTEDGTQTAVLQTPHGCDSIVTMTLHSVDNNLEVTLLTEDLCEDFEAELLAESDLPNYLWSTGETTPQITVYQSGIYWVTASDGLCVATEKITVKSCDCQLYLPNAITSTKPDGINDYFSVPQRSDRQIQAFEIMIYNRWGEMVYRSEDKHFRWRGDVNGKIMANTTYTYVVRWTNNNGKECMVTGIVTVL